MRSSKSLQADKRTVWFSAVVASAMVGTKAAVTASTTVTVPAGYSMVLFLSGLQGIPPSVLEAAALDGAGPAAKLWRIVLPLLAPTTVLAWSAGVVLPSVAGDRLPIILTGAAWPAR